MPKKNKGGTFASPNPWDKVRVRNGKLVGMLTDTLAETTLPKSGGGGTPSKVSVHEEIGAPKTYNRKRQR